MPTNAARSIITSNSDLERMDEILGIVEHDSRGGHARGIRLPGGSSQAVEAVCLGGRTVILDQHRFDSRVVDLGDRGLVVAVTVI